MYETLVHPTNTASGSSEPTGRWGVQAEGLGKRYGELWALRDLDLAIPAGTVLGLLGHNGAGKTTAIRILTTLSVPTTGRATVAGIDVARDPRGVRRRIGVASQAATVDGLRTARGNLEMVGRLYHLPKAAARQRADELLERLGLADKATTLVKTFSGGMRRRLDLAASIVAAPEVLFLDEPTTGLDPRSRAELWDLLRELVRDGATVLLTTQYLDEADRLADNIVVLDHGRAVAEGTPDELKSRVGELRVDITVASAGELDIAAAVTTALASGPPSIDRDRLVVTIPLADGVRPLQVVRLLDENGIEAIDLDRRQATLDDVFLSLTADSPEARPASRPAQPGYPRSGDPRSGYPRSGDPRSETSADPADPSPQVAP